MEFASLLSAKPPQGQHRRRFIEDNGLGADSHLTNVDFHFIASVNLTVGLATPPMGLVLFVAAAVSQEKVETIAKAILPFLAVEIAVIFLITYVPAISMTIPRLTGFVN